ncbi:hypothetical protein [Flavobacterium omnivorum]
MLLGSSLLITIPIKPSIDFRGGTQIVRSTVNKTV